MHVVNMLMTEHIVTIRNTTCCVMQVALYDFLPPEWSVTSLLDTIAASTSPQFNALIDVGALVTGMSNLEVRRSMYALTIPTLHVQRMWPTM